MHKYHLLECIAAKNLSVSYIVADLNHVEQTLLQDKNLLYNYIMNIVMNYILIY